MTNHLAPDRPVSREHSRRKFQLHSIRPTATTLRLWACGFATLLGVITALGQPVITNINPATVSTAGNTPIIISGSGFGTNGSVIVGSSSCSNVSWSATQVICLVPAGQGVDQTLILMPSTSGSAQSTLSYAAPEVTRTDTPSGPTAGGTVMNLYGANFGTVGTLTLGGKTCPVSFWSHTQITCTTPAGQGLNQPIVVTVANQTNPPVYFDYQAPQLSSASPATGPTKGGTLLYITGNNFGLGGTVTLGGNLCTNVLWTHTQIQCTTPPGQGMNQALVVTAGGQSVTANNFSYAAPGIASVSPGQVPTVGGLVTLSGTNFGLSGIVTLNGQSCSVSNWTHTQITCLVPPGQGANQLLQVSVAGASSGNYPISYAAPIISSLQPASGPTSGGTKLSISGINFGLSGSVILNGQPCPVFSWTQTNITCATPAGQGTNVGLAVTVALQSSGPVPFSYYDPAVPCAPGTYSANGFEPGVPAPPGYYVPTAGATNPTPASVGYFVTASGATNQVPAPPGSYCPVPGMATAILAPPGYFVPVSGAATLTPAAPGHFVATSGQFSADPAPTGQYAPVAGMSAPVPAPPGYYVPTLGATNPTPASAGFFVDAPAATLQSPAPPGSYCPAPGMATAIPAPPGYFVPSSGAAALTPAAPGYFVATAGQFSANPTPAGQYTPVAGMSAPIPALPGYYVPSTGASNATPAATGHYVAASAATNQLPAVPGTYCPAPAMSSSVVAPPGYFVPSAGAVAPTPAPPGHFVAAVGQATALPTPPGYYAPVSGMATPVATLPGYYVDHTGATNATAAAPGYYVPDEGATNQNISVWGFYCPIGGMRDMLPAVPGYYVAAYAATNMTPADPGYYVPGFVGWEESAAPAGTYAPVRGMQATITLGDIDGDGKVSQSELDVVLTNYWPNSPWVMMTNFTQVSNGLFQVALTNTSAWDFSVQVSSNLNGSTWSDLGVAHPVYQFTDPVTNSTQRFYRLRWP